MVRLHVKRGDESQFLLEAAGSARLADLAPLVARIYNGRLKVQRLCSGTGPPPSSPRQPERAGRLPAAGRSCGGCGAPRRGDGLPRAGAAARSPAHSRPAGAQAGSCVAAPGGGSAEASQELSCWQERRNASQTPA